MTSEDHNSGALIAALRSPALPAEQVGEAAAIAAMLEVLAVHPARHGLRTRRGLAIAAVTVASLGVGGLAAAGPGFFQAAYNKVSTIGERTSASDDDGQTSLQTHTDQAGQDGQAGSGTQSDTSGAASDENPGTDPNLTTGDIECADGNHGDTVTSVVQATDSDHGKGQIVKEAAQSECGKSVGDEVSGDEVPGAEESSEVDSGKHLGQTSRDDQGDQNGQGGGGGQPEIPGIPPVSTPVNTPPVNTPPVNTPPPNAQGGGNGDGDGNGDGNGDG